MLGNPGVPGANLPAMLDESHVMRRLADLERAYRELVASTAIRPGSLGNDALTSPIVPASVYVTVGSFALTTTMTTLRTATLIVPEGFTSAVLFISSRVTAQNDNTTGGLDGLGADELYARLTVNGGAGTAWPLKVSGRALGSDGSGINVVSRSGPQSGLTPGSAFDITVDAKTGMLGWSASVANQAEITGTVLWLR